WATLFAFLMTDFFDTMGSVVAIAGEGKFLDKEGRIPHLNRILLVDSLGALFGGVCGCSSVTTYIESASGVGEGGRTGLTSVFTALWFFLAVFLWPLVAVIPAAATAPALILVGLLLMGEIGHIDWHDFGEAFPAFLTIMTIPLTGSISRGIGFGVIASVLIRLFGGRRREIQPVMWLLALVFALDFWITR
ncbi:MAG TPA: NCS2 family permease, partial [Candidatus Aminicenantes bacterium]|nr:NCS2 family permease [Candidatus Aminicenantes bacterium]